MTEQEKILEISKMYCKHGKSLQYYMLERNRLEQMSKYSIAHYDFLTELICMFRRRRQDVREILSIITEKTILDSCDCVSYMNENNELVVIYKDPEDERD